MATNLADVYVTIIPETRRVGEAIRRAFGEAEREARRSGERMGRELDRELGDIHVQVKVGANTARAKREIEELKPHSQRVGEAMGSLMGAGIGKGLGAQLKTLKFAPIAGIAGLGLAGVGGGLASVVGVAAQASGALALIPAAAEGAALAFGALKVGASGFGDAIKNMGDEKKFAKAIADLSPNAMGAVNAIVRLKPQLEDLKRSSQDALFAGMGSQFSQLAGTYLPMVSKGFLGINQSANQAATSVMEWAKSGEGVSIFSRLLGNTNAGFGILAQAAKPAVEAVLTLGAAGSGSLPRLSQAVVDVSNRFAGFVKSADKSGRIDQWINTGMTALTQLGHALGAVGSVFATVFKAGTGTGGGMLGAIREAADSFNAFLKSADGQASLTGFFTGISQAASALAPILGTVAQIVGTTIVPALASLGTGIAPALNSLLQGLGTGLNALKPVFEQLAGPLSRLGELMGGVLAQVIPALAPALVPLAEAFVSLASALAPILPPVAKLIGDLVSALAPALSTVFNALAPVVTQLVDAFKPVLDALAPVLGEVAGQIAGVLAQAITELLPPLVPLVRSVGELLVTLLPVIPAVVQVAAAIMGALIKAMSLVLPLVARLIGDFVRLANGLGQVVVPAIKFVADGFKGLWDGIKWVLDKIGDGLDWIGNKIGGVPYLGDALKNMGVLPGHATGGLITGPGSGTSDSIVARLSNGEYVMPAAQTAQNLPLLRALHAGWSPTPGQLRSMFPGFADGGLIGDDDLPMPARPVVRAAPVEQDEEDVPGVASVDAYAGVPSPGARRATDFAHSMVGTQYSQKVFGRIGVDCSGMVSATVNSALGKDPFSSRMATPNEGGWLRARGAVEGRGGPGDLRVGWWDGGTGGGNNGHTVLQLPNGENVESGGSHGVVAVGAGAASPDDKQFNRHMYIPKELLGAMPFGPAQSDVSQDRGVLAADRRIREAQESVEDHQWRLDRAKRRVDEAKTAKERENAEHSLTVATRELADSQERLKDAQDRRGEAVAKANEKQQKRDERSLKQAHGQKDTGGEDFGQSLASGALSAIGLDGSVLSNPFEWSGVKWLTSMINGFTKPAPQQQGYGSGGAGLMSDGYGPPASDPMQLAGLAPSPALMGAPSAVDNSSVTSSSFDQSVNFNGPVGTDPNAVTNHVVGALNSRNRAYPMNAGRM